MAETVRSVPKRWLDVTASLVLALPALALGALLSIIIRLDSPGPAVFRQTRVGRNGAEFTLYKLRTMRSDTVESPSHTSSPDQITRVGRYLRLLKLDELPQLWNVASGDMSLVGPRPCLPSQTELIEHRQSLGVDRLRPGVTGRSQLAGIDMSTPERLAKSDAQYLAPWSLREDIDIIVRTALGRGSGDAASASGP